VVNNWVDLIWNKLSRWGTALVKMLPNLLLAIVVMAGFIIAAKLIKRLTEKIVHRLSGSESVTGLVSSIIYTLLLMVGLMISLKILKLDQAVTSLLAGVGIIGLALGFAFQDLTSNFISGAFIVFKRPFDVGHIVETNGFVGRVEDIQLRATMMRTLAGLNVIIPNKDIFQKPIINYSLTHERRVELEFFVSNALTLRLAEQAIQEAVDKLQTRSHHRDAEVYFSLIDENKTKIYVSYWTAHIEPDEYLKSRHEAILAITDVIIDLPKPTS
jgi:small conductance mechanosensitive channel